MAELDVEALLDARMKGTDVSQLINANPLPSSSVQNNNNSSYSNGGHSDGQHRGDGDHQNGSEHADDRKRRHEDRSESPSKRQRSRSPGRSSSSRHSSRHDSHRSDRDRDRYYRDRDRERDRYYRDRRDYERDYDRYDRRDHRSERRDRDDYYRSSRHSSHDGYERDRERERERDPEAERKHREKRQRETERENQKIREEQMSREEREAVELDRDQRTVFASNLPTRADEDDLIKYFSEAGKVRDIKLITDKFTGKSKGVGYIEFYDKSSIPTAIKLGTVQLMGQTIRIEPTFAEKNRQVTSTPMTTFSGGPTRIYVGSLQFSISQDDLRGVFSPFGEIEFVNLHIDQDTGKSKGFAFIQYKRPEDAKQALNKMNGFELAGRPIKVNLVSENNKPLSENQPTMSSSSSSSSSYYPPDLDDDEGGGIRMNAQARAALQEKLMRGNSDEPQTIAYTSACVLLKNMFDPAEESGDNWDKEIQEDVRLECSKYGSIIHIHVEKQSQGFVYIKFGSIPAAQNAINALNGRYFAAKTISADFFNQVRYHNMFPESQR